MFKVPPARKASMNFFTEDLIRIAESERADSIHEDHTQPLLIREASGLSWRQIEQAFNIARNQRASRYAVQQNRSVDRFTGTSSAVSEPSTRTNSFTRDSECASKSTGPSSLYSDLPLPDGPFDEVRTEEVSALHDQKVEAFHAAPSFAEQAYAPTIEPIVGTQSASRPFIHPTAFPRQADSSDRLGSPPLTKIYFCSKCPVGCSRKADFKAHVKTFCGSQTVWRCNGCGNCAQSKKLARSHGKKNDSCRRHAFSEIHLPYGRQAISYPWSQVSFTTVDDYLEHAIRFCEQLKHKEWPAESNLQIRSLLLGAHLRRRVETLCRNEFGGYAIIHQLWWDYGKKHASKVIEQLEYGELNVGTGVPNLGVSSTEIEEFLRTLIDDGLKNVPTYSDYQDSPPNPLLGLDNIYEYQEDARNQSILTSSAGTLGLEVGLIELPLQASTPEFTRSSVNRHKRLPSDGSIELLESTLRGSTYPFLEAQHEDRGQHLGLETSSSSTDDRTPHLDLFDSYLMSPTPDPIIDERNYKTDFNVIGYSADGDGVDTYAHGPPIHLPQRPAYNF